VAEDTHHEGAALYGRLPAAEVHAFEHQPFLRAIQLGAEHAQVAVGAVPIVVSTVRTAVGVVLLVLVVVLRRAGDRAGGEEEHESDNYRSGFHHGSSRFRPWLSKGGTSPAIGGQLLRLNS
jgi:hypothetical protein